MSKDRETDRNVGWGRSDKQIFSIPDGATGANVAPVDLGRNYAYVVIKCTDAQRIQATTTLGAQVGYDADDALVDLYEQNNPGTKWASGNLPTSGTFGCLLVHAFGAQRVRLVLSKAASGGAVPFEVYGIAESVQG